MIKYANLHLHSTYSDAQFTPGQLVLIGKSLGYRALALTDHDTDGGSKKFVSYARNLGLDAMIGAELTGLYEGTNLHLVALDYDYDNPALRAFINERVEKRTEACRKQVERGLALGLMDGITWDDVERLHPEGTWCCIDTVYDTYKRLNIPAPSNLRANVFAHPDAKKFNFKSAPAEKVIKLVREAGGVMVLAHPHWYHPFDWQKHLPTLVEYGVNGIEVSHPHNFHNTPSLARAAAKKYNLYVSGGTDHTGPMSGCDGLNAVPAGHGVSEEEYWMIKERRLG